MPNKKIAILGAAGMLGQEFMNSSHEFAMVGFDRESFDITDIDSVRNILSGFDVVINCAAWTAVDDAELNEEAAWQINGHGAENVAKVCSAQESFMIQISTDYVFDGFANEPYDENSQTAPSTAYGRTKLAGEIAVQKYLPNSHYLVRAAWLYGKYGPNFVSTMLKLQKSGEQVRVVDDQVGQPTWASDFVAQTYKMLNSNLPAGTYHATSSGQVSWCGFAKKIFELSGADPMQVVPVSSSDFPRPARRPAYSVLGHKKWLENGLAPIRDWEISIQDAFESEFN